MKNTNEEIGLIAIDTNSKFTYINATDIAKQLGRLYFGIKKTDRKNAARYISSFIYLLTMIKDWKHEYTNRYIAACCGLKYVTQVSYYRRRHSEYLYDDRYKLRINLVIQRLKKLEANKQNRFEKLMGIYNDED